jgi:hypothetical protein
MTLHNKTGDSMNKKVFTLSAVMAGLLFLPPHTQQIPVSA